MLVPLVNFKRAQELSEQRIKKVQKNCFFFAHVPLLMDLAICMQRKNVSVSRARPYVWIVICERQSEARHNTIINNDNGKDFFLNVHFNSTDGRAKVRK